MTAGRDRRSAAAATSTQCIVDALEEVKVIGGSHLSMEGRGKRRGAAVLLGLAHDLGRRRPIGGRRGRGKRRREGRKHELGNGGWAGPSRVKKGRRGRGEGRG